MSFVVSPSSHSDVAGSVTDLPSAAIVPSTAVGDPATLGGVVITGMNSSTVRMVTMSVFEPLMVGPELVAGGDARQVQRDVDVVGHQAERQGGSRRSRPGERRHAAAGRHRDPLGADDPAGHHQIPDQLVGAGAQVLVRVAQLRRRVVDRQAVPEGRQRRPRDQQHDRVDDQHLGEREAVFARHVVHAVGPVYEYAEMNDVSV